MNKYKNISELIEAFLSGETSGFSGNSPVLSNTKIVGNQILHFSTPILEREDVFIFNETKYSIQTDRLQKQIKEKLTNSEISYVSVSNVEMDYKGTLKEFIK